MPRPPTEQGQANNDSRIATLVDSAAFADLLQRARQEIAELPSQFSAQAEDGLLAAQTREWLYKREQIDRLEALVKQAAQAKQERGA